MALFLALSFVSVVVSCGGDSASSTETAAESTAGLVRATEHEPLRALLDDDAAAADKLPADDFELINPVRHR